jgi:hypothetical protein
MAWRVVVFCISALVLAGCSPWDAWGSKKTTVEHSGFLRDSAKVVSVDQGLGQVTLDLHGEQVKAYWETQTTFAQGGVVAPPDAAGGRGGPVGQYKEVAVKQQVLAASPGDTISFIGLWTGNQIFLRSVAVQGR